MRRLAQTLSMFAVSALAVGVIISVPVSADDSEDHEDKARTSESSSGTSGDAKRVHSSEDNNEVEVHKSEDHVSTETHELKERAQKLLSEKREERKTKSVAARQKACEARQAALTKKSQNYSRNGTKHLGVFDSIYDKVLAFQEAKQLEASNFDELKAAVDAKKATATSAVAAISNAGVTIDCASEDPAAAVATLKTTVKNARTALHEYRQALKDLVVALQTAKEETTESTESN